MSYADAGLLPLFCCVCCSRQRASTHSMSAPVLTVKIVGANGADYTGSVVQGDPVGEFKAANGNTYVGQYANGKMQGIG